MLISDFMEQNKLLPYNLESNGRGLADQRGRSFRVVVTFGYFKCWGYLLSSNRLQEEMISRLTGKGKTRLAS